MARITDYLVIQRVGDRLVIINDVTGQETTIRVTAGVRLTAMVAYLTNPDDPDGVWEQAREQLKAVGAVQ